MVGVNEDLSRLIVVSMESCQWVEVSGAEVCVLESLPAGVESLFVRLPPSGHFPFPQPAGDLEIFLLTGSLHTVRVRLEAGTYLRIPQRAASGFSLDAGEDGCLVFVKRKPEREGKQEIVAIDTRKSGWVPGLVSGLSVMSLFSSEGENTALVRWDPGTFFQPHRHYGGEEVLVVSGVFEDEHGRYPAGTWYRAPHLSLHDPFSTEGCTILVKTGHLAAYS